MASTTIFKLPPQKPLNSTNKPSRDLREHRSAFTSIRMFIVRPRLHRVLSIGFIYRLTPSQFLSSVFSVSLGRVSFHTFLLSARRPSSFVCHPSSVAHRFSLFVLSPIPAVVSVTHRPTSSIFRHFVRIRVAIVHNIVGPCCTALRDKPKAHDHHQDSKPVGTDQEGVSASSRGFRRYLCAKGTTSS